MTRIGFQAIVAVFAFTLACVPAWADADPAIVALSDSELFPSVDDAELAAANARGLAADSTSMGDGSQTRLAVILWDETKPPIAQASSLAGIEQAGRHIVISVGNGH